MKMFFDLNNLDCGVSCDSLIVAIHNCLSLNLIPSVWSGLMSKSRMAVSFRNIMVAYRGNEDLYFESYSNLDYLPDMF